MLNRRPEVGEDLWTIIEDSGERGLSSWKEPYQARIVDAKEGYSGVSAIPTACADMASERWRRFWAHESRLYESEREAWIAFLVERTEEVGDLFDDMQKASDRIRELQKGEADATGD